MAFAPRGARRDPSRFFEHALRLLQRICDHDDRRLVLFVDELQELGAARRPFGDPDAVMNLMRSVLQQSPSVTCLFAGSVQHMLRDLLAAEHRAFYQWGAWFELEPIGEATWRKGLMRRIGRAGLRFDTLALERPGERQARTTMLLAQQAYLVALTDGRDEIDVGTVEVALEQALNADAAAHQATVEQIRPLGRHVLDVAVRIAAGEPPYGTGSPNSAKRAIDALCAQGLIEQRGAHGRGGWVVPDPLLRRYLARLG